MLNHNDRVALLHEIAGHLDQFLRVVEVEPGGRLVQRVQRFPGRPFREFPGELDIPQTDPNEALFPTTTYNSS